MLPETVESVLKKFASTKNEEKQLAALHLYEVLKDKKISVTDVLDNLNDVLPLGDYINESNKDICLGRSLIYSVLVELELVQDKGSILKGTLKDLLKLRLRTDDSSAISVRTLCQIIAKVNKKHFEKYVWPKLTTILSIGWTNCTGSRLCILLACIKYHKKSIPANFLKTNWCCDEVLSSDRYSRLTKLLQDDQKNGNLEFLIESIIDHVYNRCKDVNAFWDAVGEHLLRQEDTRHQDVGCLLINKSVSYSSHQQISAVLSTDFFVCVKKRLSTHRGASKVKTDCRHVKDMLASLVTKVAQSPGNEVQLTVLNCFIENSEKISFDDATRTNTFSSIVHHLNAEVTSKYCDILKDILCCEKRSMNIRLWVLSQLSSSVTIPSVGSNSDFQLSILCYLARHSIFISKDHKSQQLESQIRVAMMKQLYKSLNSLSTYKPVGCQRDPIKYIDLVYGLAKRIQKMINDGDLDFAETVEENVVTEWKRMYKHVKAIRKKKQDSKLGESHAFQLLFLHMGLQLFSEPQQAHEILKDVYQCHERASQKRDSREDVHWMSVITEVLVSILCQPSHLARKVAQTVYALLHEDVTPQSIEIIVNVLIADDSEAIFGDDDDDVGDDDDDDAEGSNNDDENTDEDDEDVIMNEKDSEEDSGVEDDGSVDDAFRKTVEAALGSAAVLNADVGEEHKEEENADVPDDSSDVDDETMIRLDPTLSEVFRSRFSNNKKQIKQKKEQLTHLKLRALDLLESLTHSATFAKGNILIMLLRPLLQVFNLKYIDADLSHLSHKAINLYHTIIKQKKAIMGLDFDREDIFSRLSDLIEFSKTVTNDEVIDVISRGYMLLVAVLFKTHGSDDTKNSKATHERFVTDLSALLKDYFYKPESRLRENFFKKIIRLNPLQLWPIAPVLLSVLEDESAKIFKKTQAALMLSPIVTKFLVNHVDSGDLASFLIRTMDVCLKIIHDTDKTDIKPKLLYASFDLILKCLQMDNANGDCKQMINDETRTKFVSLIDKTAKDCKKLIKKVIVLVPSSEPVKGPTKKKRKAQNNGDSTAGEPKKVKSSKKRKVN